MRGTTVTTVWGVALCRGLLDLVRLSSRTGGYSLSFIASGSLGFLRQLIRLSVSQKHCNRVPSIDRPPAPCNTGDHPVPRISPFHPARQHPKHGEDFEGRDEKVAEDRTWDIR